MGNPVSAGQCRICDAVRGQDHHPSCMFAPKPDLLYRERCANCGVDRAFHFQRIGLPGMFCSNDFSDTRTFLLDQEPVQPESAPQPAGGAARSCNTCARLRECDDLGWPGACKNRDQLSPVYLELWQPVPAASEGIDIDAVHRRPEPTETLRAAPATDAELLRQIARGMSYNATVLEAETKHRLREIAGLLDGGMKHDPLHAMTVPGYDSLAAVLRQAYAQAADGKGRERHGRGAPFHQQPMQDLIRLHGIGFATGQAGKKAQEAQRMPADRAVRELLGAINYLAGAIIAIEAGSNATTTTTS